MSVPRRAPGECVRPFKLIHNNDSIDSWRQEGLKVFLIWAFLLRGLRISE